MVYSGNKCLRRAIRGPFSPRNQKGHRRTSPLATSYALACSRRSPTSALPTGTVSFLFTDIEASTRLLQHLGDGYVDVLAQYQRLLRSTVGERGGQVVDTQGDALFVAFARARDALVAAIEVQRAIHGFSWPEDTSILVRMGLHTGEPLSAATGYVGMDVHRAARICVAGHGGQILLSMVTRELIADDLPEGVSLQDLGEHRLKDLARPQHLFQVVAPGLRANFPPLKSLDSLPNNLPIQLTSFIGREREMSEVKRLLATTRLLTLTGAGGAGKTRLLLQVAAELLEEFIDGVWLVDLASLSQPDLVPQTVASAVSLREQPGCQMIETLSDFLRRKSLLLLLDNCEHLVSACAQVTHTLLRACPCLRILATSRERLGVAGETAWRVPSLSLPDPQRLPSLECLTEYEAIRLFLERAVAVLPTFAATNQNAQWIAGICHQLDGMPLAVELAAARVNTLSPEQIATRLGGRFRLLTGGSRTDLPRHQTLRGAMDWSYDLLSEKEKVLLRRLSVFAGGWTLEAAEEVCSGEGLEAHEVLDLLAHLVEKSLVVAEQPRSARYRLLETVRQYARERLLEAGESDELRARHRDSFNRQAEAPEPTLDAWLQRIETEHDNMRAVLEWSREKGDTETILRLANALDTFWNRRGYWREGRQWLELALARTSGVDSSLRARALYSVGTLAWLRGDISSVVYLEESLALRRELEDKEGMAASLDMLGIAAYRQGDYTKAVELLEQSLTLRREQGRKEPFTLYLLGIVARIRGDYELAEALGGEALDLSREMGRKRGSGLSLDSLGLLACCRCDYKQARALCEEGLALFRATGDKFGIAGSLNSLALVAFGQCDYNRAVALCEESLILSRETGDKGAMARSLNVLGRVVCCQGEYEHGVALQKESLALFWELRDKLGIVRCLEASSAVACVQREWNRGARLLGAAEGLREVIGAFLPPAERPELDRNIGALRAALGEETFSAEWANSRGMTLEQAVECALNVANGATKSG